MRVWFIIDSKSSKSHTSESNTKTCIFPTKLSGKSKRLEYMRVLLVGILSNINQSDWGEK